MGLFKEESQHVMAVRRHRNYFYFLLLQQEKKWNKIIRALKILNCPFSTEDFSNLLCWETGFKTCLVLTITYLVEELEQEFKSRTSWFCSVPYLDVPRKEALFTEVIFGRGGYSIICSFTSVKYKHTAPIEKKNSIIRPPNITTSKHVIVPHRHSSPCVYHSQLPWTSH